MARLIVVTRSKGNISRGDVTAVKEDFEEVGRDVEKLDLFRVVEIPGEPASAYMHLVEEEGHTDILRQYDFRIRGLDLDRLETLEVAAIKRPLSAMDSVKMVPKEAFISVEYVKPIKFNTSIVMDPKG